MLETKCVGDKLEMLVTDFTIFVTKSYILKISVGYQLFYKYNQ